MITHTERRERLALELSSARAQVGLDKRASNLFRDRATTGKHLVDVHDFNHVLAVEPSAGWIEAEGMTPYDTLVSASLARGVMPPVVPQLKSITLGGAVAGVGIESSSFKYGLVHETVLEMDVLLSSGEVVRCAPDNEHSALYFGFPNSYGTLGYALRIRIQAVPVKPYVHLRYRRFASHEQFFRELGECALSDLDFLDGVVFGEQDLVLCLGQFRQEAPYTSDYTYQNIYYQSLRQRQEDFLHAQDYLWRWDTDWFWCSKNLGAQHPLVRRVLGRQRLNSRFYTRVMRWNSRWRLTHAMDRLLNRHRESVIQDVDIPLASADRFLRFLMDEIGILPIWICPARAYRPTRPFALFPMRPDTTYVNFGFWDVVRTRDAQAPGHFNRLIERQVALLGGIKSLYSDSFHSEEEFWQAYDQGAYAHLKARYDPKGLFPDLYQKCVRGQ